VAIKTRGSGDRAPSRRRLTWVWGRSPNAAAILQLFPKNYAFLSIFWSKFLLKIVFLNDCKCVDALPKPAFRLYALTFPLPTPLFTKSCTVFQISLCLFSLTSMLCNCANFNRLMHMQVQPL